MGRLDPIPVIEIAEPAFSIRTEEDIFREFNRSQDDVKRVAKRYDLASWLAINQLVYLPIQDWIGKDPWFEKHGLDDALKKAIAHEVEEIVRQRESSRREAEKKLEMQRMEHNSKLQFPRDPGPSITRFFQ